MKLATHEVIAEKVAEGMSDPLPRLMPRDLSLGEASLPARGNVVKLVAGVRRCGKTYRLYQEMQALVSRGVPRSHLLYFNFDDERLLPYETAQLEELLAAYQKARPAAREDGVYLFLDEIQEVPGWGAFLRRVVDSWNATIYVTGSSSRMLSSEMPSEFRGRALTYELFPYSLSEFCRAQGACHSRDEAASSDGKASLRNSLDAYLLRGGFPAADALARSEAFQLLQGYVSQTVSQDIVDRHGIKNHRAARSFVSRCIAFSGRELSISKSQAALRSAGVTVARETLSDLLSYYEESYLVFQNRELSRKLSDNTRSATKVYAVDPGLVAAFSPATARDLGQRLETAVFDALRRRAGFLRAGAISRLLVDEGAKRHEVDFATGDILLDEPLELVQVATDLDDSRTRKRELDALTTAMERFGRSEATLVTLDDREVVTLPQGTIRVVPAWDWLLD